MMHGHQKCEKTNAFQRFCDFQGSLWGAQNPEMLWFPMVSMIFTISNRFHENCGNELPEPIIFLREIKDFSNSTEFSIFYWFSGNSIENHKYPGNPENCENSSKT